MERTKLAAKIFAIVLLLQLIFFYRGVYIPEVQVHNVSEISVPRAAQVEFVDTAIKSEGVAAIDFSHENLVSASELNVLAARLAARGIDVIYAGNDSSFESALRQASSLIVIAPKKPFTSRETALVKEFVERGGRLLLIGDPTRESEINSLASSFGIMFEKDYLYNLKENEGNFRNVFVRNFKQSEVTANLKTLVLYVAGSITSKDSELASVDGSTLSSSTEKGSLSPIVMVGGVLAIGDLTFMIEPYNLVEDNNRFVSNIADFLANAKKEYSLADFPHMFRKEVVIASSANTLHCALRLKSILEASGKNVAISAAEDKTKDSLLLGLYSDYVALSYYLDEANISLRGEEVNIAGVGRSSQKDSYLVYYKKQGERNVVLLLADSRDTMEKAIDVLESGRIKSVMLNDSLAFLPSKDKEVAKPKPEANVTG